MHSGKRKDDLADFLPENFIEICEKFKVKESIPILKKFVEKDFQIYEKISALSAIAKIEPDEKYFKDISKKYLNINCNTHKLGIDANKYLIEIFNNKKAIKWRLDELGKKYFPYVDKAEAGWVGQKENELFDKEFARPIMNIKDPQYQDQFIQLLDKSIEIYKKGSDYWSYINYLWDIVFKYFNNLKELRSYNPLKKLEKFIYENSDMKGLNWFSERLQDLKREYIQYLGKPKDISECIKKYNKFKEIQYLDIGTDLDLFELLKDVIKKDLKKWVEDEGAYKFIQNAGRKQEDLIQKTIKTQFENCLLKKGFRNNEINIRRESQLLDDKRTDFLVSYGFIGPILIEIKRAENNEVTNKTIRLKYSKKLNQYIKGTNSKFGVYLIFKTDKNSNLFELQKKVSDSVKGMEISVLGLDCVKGNGGR